jgi:hypothetical protein
VLLKRKWSLALRDDRERHFRNLRPRSRVSGEGVEGGSVKGAIRIIQSTCADGRIDSVSRVLSASLMVTLVVGCLSRLATLSERGTEIGSFRLRPSLEQPNTDNCICLSTRLGRLWKAYSAPRCNFLRLPLHCSRAQRSLCSSCDAVELCGISREHDTPWWSIEEARAKYKDGFDWDASDQTPTSLGKDSSENASFVSDATFARA